MHTARALYYLMLADYLERVRRYSFLIVLTATVLVGYSMIPSVDAPYNAFAVGVYRPFYNSAWVGTVFGMVIATMVTLLGFFLVRNAVPRDYQTRVGQIIATTPVSRPLYMLGKWLSNLAVLSSILVVLTVVALIMQLVRAEDLHLDLWALVAPIWFIGLPPLALVAAISILFECVPVPSGLGNILFLLMWGASIVFLAGPFIDSVGQQEPSNDLFGLSRVMSDLRTEMISLGLDPSVGVTDLYQPTGGKETQRFVWEGVGWNLKTLFERLLWIALAAVIAMVAAIPFDRFDPAKWQVREGKRKPKSNGDLQTAGQDTDGLTASSDYNESEFMAEGTSLTPLSREKSNSRLGTTVVSEFLLMVKGRSLWWYASTAGLSISVLFTSERIFHGFVTPFLWLWPIFVWSGMGSRERTCRTTQLVFPVAHLVRRQLPAIWVAGCLLAALATGGPALRLAATGEWNLLFGWAVASMFIPALALTLGVWTNGGRTFEIVYFLLWLAAAKDPVLIFNFMGRSREPGAEWALLVYIAVTAMLLVCAAAGRKRQIVSSLR